MPPSATASEALDNYRAYSPAPRTRHAPGSHAHASYRRAHHDAPHRARSTLGSSPRANGAPRRARSALGSSPRAHGASRRARHGAPHRARSALGSSPRAYSASHRARHGAPHRARSAIGSSPRARPQRLSSRPPRRPHRARGALGSRRHGATRRAHHGASHRARSAPGSTRDSHRNRHAFCFGPAQGTGLVELVGPSPTTQHLAVQHGPMD